MQMGNGGTGAFNNCAGQSWSMFPGPFDEAIWGAQYGGCSYREVLLQDYATDFAPKNCTMKIGYCDTFAIPKRVTKYTIFTVFLDIAVAQSLTGIAPRGAPAATTSPRTPRTPRPWSSTATASLTSASKCFTILIKIET